MSEGGGCFSPCSCQSMVVDVVCIVIVESSPFRGVGNTTCVFVCCLFASLMVVVPWKSKVPRLRHIPLLLF